MHSVIENFLSYQQQHGTITIACCSCSAEFGHNVNYSRLTDVGDHVDYASCYAAMHCVWNLITFSLEFMQNALKWLSFCRPNLLNQLLYHLHWKQLLSKTPWTLHFQSDQPHSINVSGCSPVLAAKSCHVSSSDACCWRFRLCLSLIGLCRKDFFMYVAFSQVDDITATRKSVHMKAVLKLNQKVLLDTGFERCKILS